MLNNKDSKTQKFKSYSTQNLHRKDRKSIESNISVTTTSIKSEEINFKKFPQNQNFYNPNVYPNQPSIQYNYNHMPYNNQFPQNSQFYQPMPQPRIYYNQQYPQYQVDPRVLPYIDFENSKYLDNNCRRNFSPQFQNEFRNCYRNDFRNRDFRQNINPGYYRSNHRQELDILKEIIYMMKDKEVRHKRNKIKKNKIKKKVKEVKLGSTIFCATKGDWQCPVPDCKNWNYSKRNKCNMCSHPKKNEIIKNFVHIKEKKTKQTKKIRKDWKCTKCCFINSDYKDQCYRCSENKPEENENER